MPNLLPASQQVTEEHFVHHSPTHLYAGGSLKVVDPDHDEAYLKAETVTTAHQGEFTVSARGGWSYKIDNAIDEVQKLGAGESFTESHTVYSKDGTASQVLTVTVQGTNDAPRVSAEAHLVSGTEDTDLTFSASDLLSNASDIDNNDASQLAVANLVADHGLVVDNLNGTFTFKPQPNYNGQVHFTYDVKDGHSGVVHTGATTTLTAVDDSSVISGDSLASVTEGNIADVVVTSGTLAITDVDSGDHPDFPDVTSVATNYGHITMVSGQWTYTLDQNKVQQLNPSSANPADHQVTDQHTFTASDGSTQTVSVVIAGSNDAPVILDKGSDLSGRVEEDSAADTINGQLLMTDVDTTSGHSWSVSADPAHTPQYGSMTVDSSGRWQYVLDNGNADVNRLGSGEVLEDKVTLRVDDGDGGVTTKEVVVTINGHDDQPAALAVPTLPVWSSPPRISGQQGNQDVHASLGVPTMLPHAIPSPTSGWGISDGHGGSAAVLPGRFGTLSVNPLTGELHYDYHTNSGVVKHGGGASDHDETDVFTVTLGGANNAMAEVHLHVHSQSIHGNSGHHIDRTSLVDMELLPLAPTQSDSPEEQPVFEQFSVSIDDSPASPVEDYLDVFQQAGVEFDSQRSPEHDTAESVTGDYFDALVEDGATFDSPASQQELDQSALATQLNTDDDFNNDQRLDADVDVPNEPMIPLDDQPLLPDEDHNQNGL